MKIEPLINVAFTHEYNDKSNSSRLFNIESKIKSRAVLGGSLFPFIHTEANRYSIVGDKEELLDHLSTTPEGLNFEFRVHLTDPNFLYYTRSLLPDEQNDPDIQIRIIDNRLNLMSVIIHVTKELFKARCPIEKNIHYQTKEAYWDFILIPRNPDYIPTEIFMEDNGSEGICFKNPEQIRFMNKDAIRISTVNPIKIKEWAYYQRESNITIYEKREYANRVLLQHVPIPEPGRFSLKELQSNENSILHIMYI
jgi:hypothetical protein